MADKTIDAKQDAGLQSGLTEKEALNADPKKLGMDPGNGNNQSVPARPVADLGRGFRLK